MRGFEQRLERLERDAEWRRRLSSTTMSLRVIFLGLPCGRTIADITTANAPEFGLGEMARKEKETSQAFLDRVKEALSWPETERLACAKVNFGVRRTESPSQAAPNGPVGLMRCITHC